MNAQFNYAIMVDQGQGGNKNLDEARDFYKKAADQEHMEAQFHYLLTH